MNKVKQILTWLLVVVLTFLIAPIVFLYNYGGMEVLKLITFEYYFLFIKQYYNSGNDLRFIIKEIQYLLVIGFIITTIMFSIKKMIKINRMIKEFEIKN